MPQFIGMDEAGYGPNLGPLVITATAWEVPEAPHACDLWRLLEEAVTEHPACPEGRLHIADSKRVFSPSRGLAALEASVLCLLRWGGYDVDSFHAVWRQLTVRTNQTEEQEPWFASDVKLPVAADVGVLDHRLDCLAHCAEKNGVHPPRVRCDVVLTDRFNRLSAQYNSKGRTLSSLSLSLLSKLWTRNFDDVCLIIADKHGGRNRYDELLADVLDGEMIFRVQEGRECSIYRVGKTEIRFQTKAESHFPVAAASLVSKYLREIAMVAFNRFWRDQIPGLKPTQGYPQDARRFRAEIAVRQAALQIPDRILWRER
ncbi:MAG: hypothetical protein AB7U20_03805 [Planctomycetaceae bacterium]